MAKARGLRRCSDQLRTREIFYRFRVSPIIKYRIEQGYSECIQSPETISDYKTTFWGKCITEDNTDKTKLYKCIFELIKKIDLIYSTESIKYIFFDNPITMRAQTNNDRTGYGNQWCGPYRYIEGTLYGDTHCFYIVGFKCFRI